MKRKSTQQERFTYLDQIGPVVELAYYWRFEQEIEYSYCNPVHGLTLVERGCIEWDTPDGLVRSVAGDLIYNRPAPHGHYRVCAPAAMYVAGLRFASRPFHLRRLYVADAGPLPVRLPLGTAFAAMRSLMETLCIEVPRDGVEHRLTAQATVYQMLALIARVMHAAPATSVKVDAWERARIRLAAVESQDLKIADLADEMNVSVQYFQRAFRRRFGDSPKAYQQHSRIREAVRRLRESDTSFKVIAYEMGFRDPKILYHAICRHLGIGPSKLRMMSAEELRDRMLKDRIPFPLNCALVPPGTAADWVAKHKVKTHPPR